jgi:hypothetical protein
MFWQQPPKRLIQDDLHRLVVDVEESAYAPCRVRLVDRRVGEMHDCVAMLEGA